MCNLHLPSFLGLGRLALRFLIFFASVALLSYRSLSYKEMSVHIRQNFSFIGNLLF